MCHGTAALPRENALLHHGCKHIRPPLVVKLAVAPLAEGGRCPLLQTPLAAVSAAGFCDWIERCMALDTFGLGVVYSL